MESRIETFVDVDDVYMECVLLSGLCCRMNMVVFYRIFLLIGLNMT